MKYENTQKSLDESAKLIVDTLVKALSRYGLGTSELAKNLTYKIDRNVLVLEMPEYGEYLDEGTKPHSVPVSAIRSWAREKGLNEWAVATNIKKFGTKAKPFLKSINSILPKVDQEITEGILADLEAATDEIFQDNFKKVK